MSLTVLIPCYNEAKTLQTTLPPIKEELQPETILIVDDGSTDKTRRVAKEHGCVLTPKRSNKGKGYSVKQGLQLVETKYALLTDADLSTPITQYHSLKKHIDAYDVVIGSRGLPRSQEKTTLTKKLGGGIGNILIWTTLGLSYKDTQCGFKLFTQEAAKKISGRLTVNGFGYDFEALLIAKRQGLTVKETPVKWVLDEDSAVTPKDYFQTLKELYIVKKNDLDNKYV